MLISIFDQLCEFSRSHCIGICGCLVPFNLTLSCLTLVHVGRQMSPDAIRKMAIAVYCGVTIMVLHVSTWFLIGVVMIPTFVLPVFGAVCVAISVWATKSPESMRQFLLWLLQPVLHRKQSAAT
ncbi:MAG: hypothetical protein WBB82_06925 [Limnothrix sp.]